MDRRFSRLGSYLRARAWAMFRLPKIGLAIDVPCVVQTRSGNENRGLLLTVPK